MCWLFLKYDKEFGYDRFTPLAGDRWTAGAGLAAVPAAPDPVALPDRRAAGLYGRSVGRPAGAPWPVPHLGRGAGLRPVQPADAGAVAGVGAAARAAIGAHL